MSAELRWGTDTLEAHVRLKGGWGTENLTSACGWIATGLRWRTAKHSTFVIHTGRGMVDNVLAVLDGTVDLAFTTPTVTASMALSGSGPYPQPHPGLRAIAALPHRDRLLFAVTLQAAERYGLHTFADFAARRPPLRVATGLNDGINIVGYSVERVLQAYGLAWDDLEGWGGKWLVSETPHPALHWFASGEADALFYEAVTLWQKFLGQTRLHLLPIEREVLDQLQQGYGYEQAEIEPGEFPGVERPVPTLDFSQWLLVAREELPEELAYLVAQVIVEDRADFETRYQHLPLKESALHYPIQPEKICQTTPIPLHPGAARYYDEHGYLAASSK